LGRALFYDPILSRDSSISCAGCHLQATGFTHSDHRLSHGINGLIGTRNSGTLANLAWSSSFMWDGSVNNIEVQAINPITNPLEMDSRLEDVVRKLNASAPHRKMFYRAFNDSIVTSPHLLKALTQFVVMFGSWNSKYDKKMRNQKGIEFTAQEENGLRLFRLHCESCHKEPLFTDNSFKNNGIAYDPELKDTGRMKITGNKEDSLKFKVPSLRNIFVSGPYMHDGRFRSLEQVLDHYTRGIQQHPGISEELIKPVNLTKNEKLDVIMFLRTLTDKELLTDERFRYAAVD
jgi:cytochrome c peroxidase